MPHLVEGDPHDVALQRGDPIELPAARQARDLLVERSDVCIGALGELAVNGFAPSSNSASGRPVTSRW